MVSRTRVTSCRVEVYVMYVFIQAESNIGQKNSHRSMIF